VKLATWLICRGSAGGEASDTIGRDYYEYKAQRARDTQWLSDRSPADGVPRSLVETRG